MNKNNTIKSYFHKLFPLNRSLTGEGVRKSLQILNKITSFNIYEVKSGTKVFDWEVPNEWSVREAYIETPTGEKIADFSINNLHLVGYSIPIDRVMDFEELNQHLHSIPSHPDAIPYRTSYYEQNWGFCISDNQRKKLPKGKYHIFIDSNLKSGSMTMGEQTLKGSSKKEYIISTYSCHPSMANDNISGMLGWAYLLKEIRKKPTKHTYRFIIGPETIGALTYLSTHDVSNVSGVVIMTHLVGPGKYCYKKTFLGNSEVDRAIKTSFKELGISYNTAEFNIKGSDERQFSSPGFRIPTALITKPKLYSDPNYHTSYDNSFSPKIFKTTLSIFDKIIENLENNKTFFRTNPYGEPKLSGRNLYPKVGGIMRPDTINSKNLTDAILWVLFYADGRHTIEDISELSGFQTKQLKKAIEKLLKAKLIK